MEVIETIFLVCLDLPDQDKCVAHQYSSQGNQSKDRIKPERHVEDKKCRNDTSQPQRRGQDCHGESGQRLDLENDHASVQTNMIGNTLASAAFALSDSSALAPTSILYPSGSLAIMG